jgi:pantoate--beta-alanine ligase
MNIPQKELVFNPLIVSPFRKPNSHHMIVITTADEMTRWSDRSLRDGKTIGMVPTMGALHDGHISLVERAARGNDLTVVSVFVNPIQFNNANDLARYPRTFDADRELLAQAGVDVMFHPSVSEIYPSHAVTHYDLDGLDAYMEGPHRPGHFDGVVQVVSRLFDIVRPTAAFFGEKDFQQLAIIRHMTRKLGYALEVIGCPTMREADGVAMSSRNTLLSSEWRSKAPVVFEVLEDAMERVQTEGVGRTKEYALKRLEAAGFRAEYFELVDPVTLQPVDEGYNGPIQACVAVWAGEVRLIDNLRVK